ncbi:hypothetical protein Nepgr_029214 [Nepenthes gracilis]|uniref:NAC domain-containing protein n=1 Tax=Nepenthes gracilis TaxID=150966 RepID=A0AAD3TDR0_NEPGR|nr:hypothetical protein Nepgr_029214 [Nepenthes gracilis]
MEDAIESEWKREVNDDDDELLQVMGGLPRALRFHPTDEELITFYIASKVVHGGFSGAGIAHVDLNRCQPWDLPGEGKIGRESVVFLQCGDGKYRTGMGTNRATGAGYSIGTGKDRGVHGHCDGVLLGMKMLMFYRGRGPGGVKTEWVMREYRLDGRFSCRHTCKHCHRQCLFPNYLRTLLSSFRSQNPQISRHYPNPAAFPTEWPPSPFSTTSFPTVNHRCCHLNNNYNYGNRPPLATSTHFKSVLSGQDYYYTSRKAHELPQAQQQYSIIST